MPAKIVIFDFDGVILESNRIKDNAFHDLYLPHGRGAAARALKIHLSHHGRSRFEKFAMMHQEILDREITAAESAELGRQFTEKCFHEICRCPFVPGALEFLEQYHQSHILAVASATPEDELKEIVAARNLQKFFKHVFGKPTSKSDNLRKIILLENVPASAAVFVGDQISDWESAHAVGVRFIGRVPGGDVSPFPAEGPARILPDLKELAACLQEGKTL